MSDAEVRAREAAMLLDNALFQEAMAALDKEVVDAWKGTKPDATADRERIYALMSAQRRLTAYFQQIVEEGRFAANRATRAPIP